MREGNVILTPVPQADGVLKNRPAIVLRELPPYQDLLICGISTQIHQQVLGFDELIMRTDPDFKSSGILYDSLIRLGFLTVLPRKSIIGAIGSISKERHERLLTILAEYLTNNIGQNEDSTP